MQSFDPYTYFPAYAVFIGANMGMAAYMHFKSLTKPVFTYLRHFMALLLVVSALSAIIGSSTLANHPTFGRVSIWLLLGAYIFMLVIFLSGPPLALDEKVAQDNLDDQNLENRR